MSVGRHTIVIHRPVDAEALIDEEAFEHEEFLPYWAELWPSALALAREVAARDLAGLRVLELGCGLALPSVVAALGGARVLATDWAPEALPFAAANAEENAARVDVALASWGQPSGLVAAAPWDLVLAADVLYERRNVDLLLELLPRLVDASGQVLVADPSRPPAAWFLDRARAEWEVDSASDSVAPRVLVHALRPR